MHQSVEPDPMRGLVGSLRMATADSTATIAARYSDEPANAFTHGAGLGLSIIGAATLLFHAYPGSGAGRLAGLAIYGASLVAVYAASTLSHSVRDPWARQRLRIVDQAVIYLLIAGTYTAFAVEYLHDRRWWLLLALEWGIALWGFRYKLSSASDRVGVVAIASYVLLGWLPTLAIVPMVRAIPPDCMQWIVLGGLSYTIGVAFLVMDERARYFHAVWHLFVIVGSGCHFYAIFKNAAMPIL